MPELEEQVGRGEFAPLREWLREHVHALGRKYSPQETIRRALESSNGVKKDAADLMGISQRALSYYLSKYKFQ